MHSLWEYCSTVFDGTAEPFCYTSKASGRISSSSPELSTDPGLRLGRACGSAPALAPSTESTRSLLSNAHVLGAGPGRLSQLTQPSIAASAERNSADPERCSVKGQHRWLHRARKAPPPTDLERLDKGRCGKAAGTHSQHLPMSRVPDTFLQRSTWAGRAGVPKVAGRTRCAACRTHRCTQLHSLYDRVCARRRGPRPQGPPKRRDFSGKGKQDFVL